MLIQLGWPTLQPHCLTSRLIFFYKIIHEIVSLTLLSNLYQPSIQQDHIIVSTLLSLAILLQYISRAFTSELAIRGWKLIYGI